MIEEWTGVKDEAMVKVRSEDKDNRTEVGNYLKRRIRKMKMFESKSYVQKKKNG